METLEMPRYVENAVREFNEFRFLPHKPEYAWILCMFPADIRRLEFFHLVYIIEELIRCALYLPSQRTELQRELDCVRLILAEFKSRNTIS